MSPTTMNHQHRGSRSRPSRRRARQQARQRMVLAAGAMVLVVLAVSGAMIQSARRDAAAPSPGAVPAPLTASGGLQLGTGPVTVDVYTDFQCPACRRFHSVSGTALADLVRQGGVTLAYHPMSFLGEESVRAANAATAAFAQGRLLEYASVLYANQPDEHSGGYQDDELVARGREAGVPDLAAFERAVRDQTYRPWVLTVDDGASSSGVNSTPTVLVAGQRLADPTPAGLRTAVASAAP